MTHPWDRAVDIASWMIVIPVFAWFLWRTYERSDGRRALLLKWIISVPLILAAWRIIHIRSGFTPIILLIPTVTLGLMWAPNFANLIFRPITGAFDGGDADGEKKPFYFTAEGKRRKGLYPEAIAEVRKQLEQFPGDYEGYIRMATIQAECLKDLRAAEATLNEFMQIPDREPKDVVAALHLLADWQLQYDRNPAKSIATLRLIVDNFPGTPFAHAAEQRIAHFETAGEAIQSRHEKKFVVLKGEQNIGLHQGAPQAPAAIDPHTQAEEFVRQLEKHPSDTDTREKLATLYAEAFQRVDLAVDQLEQLIALPSEPPKHVARWLNLLATLQIQHAHDGIAAEKTLRRISEKFPGSALAIMAGTRLATLNSELKGHQPTAAKALGNYEKQIGLKQARG